MNTHKFLARCGKSNKSNMEISKKAVNRKTDGQTDKNRAKPGTNNKTIKNNDNDDQIKPIV